MFLGQEGLYLMKSASLFGDVTFYQAYIGGTFGGQFAFLLLLTWSVGRPVLHAKNFNILLDKELKAIFASQIKLFVKIVEIPCN